MFYKLFLSLLLILGVVLIPNVLGAEKLTNLTIQSRILKLEKMEKEKSELEAQERSLKNERVTISSKISKTWEQSENITEKGIKINEHNRSSLIQKSEIATKQLHDCIVKINEINRTLSLTNLKELQMAEILVQGFKDKGFIPKSSYVENIISDYHNFTAKSIIFIKDRNSLSIVAKVLRNYEYFVQEHKNLTRGISPIEHVNGLRKKCRDPLPIIVNSKGGLTFKMAEEMVGVFLLDKAQGNPLDSYLDWEDEKLRGIFTKIGAQFGTLDDLMLKEDGKILVRDDVSLSNLIYDHLNDRLYWIDNAGFNGLQLIKITNGCGTEGSPYIFSTSFYNFLTVMRDLVKDRRLLGYWGNKENQFLSYYKRMKKVVMAIRASAQGYYNKNRQIDINFYNLELVSPLFDKNAFFEKLYGQSIFTKLKLQPLDFDRDFAIT